MANHHRKFSGNSMNTGISIEPNSLKNDIEILLSTLLPVHFRALAFSRDSIAFDSHHGFVGKRKLKEGLLRHLPITQLEKVGFGKAWISQIMNDMLKSGLTMELIHEAKKRKDFQVATLSGDRFTACDPAFITAQKQVGDRDISHDNGATSKGYSGRTSPTTPTRNLRPKYDGAHTPTKSDSGYSGYTDILIGRALKLSVPQGELRSYIPSTNASTSPEPGYAFSSPSVVPVLPSKTCSPDGNLKVYLPFPLQHQLLTYLQWSLESACYIFVKYYLPDVFQRKPAYATCPQAAELKDWNKVITMASFRLPLADPQSFQNTIKMTDYIRHDAVHRNVICAEKVLAHIEAAIAMVGLFREFSLATIDAFNNFELHHRALSSLDGPVRTILNSTPFSHELAVCFLQKQLKELHGCIDLYSGKIVESDEDKLARNLSEREREISASLDLDSSHIFYSANQSPENSVTTRVSPQREENFTRYYAI